MRGALFFPYIRPPERPWFTRTLLYWDAVGTITPSSFGRRQQRDQLGEYASGLKDAGLLRLVPPDRYTVERATYGQEFLRQVLANSNFSDRKRRDFEQGSEQQLHSHKADHEVLSGLVEAGLASKPDPSWYLVERSVAELYMAGLALVLSRCQDIPFDPVTDAASGLGPLSLQVGEEDLIDGMHDRDRIRTELLEFSLPTPTQPIPPADIAVFKHKHQAALSEFRAFIESKVLDISTEPDAERRALKMATVSDEIEARRAEVQRLLDERRWKTNPFGSLITVLTPVGGGIAGAAAGSAVAIPVAAPLVLIAVAAGLSRTAKASEMSLPFAYAAAAATAFGPR